MKRLILILSGAAIILGSSSCQKTYTCSCVSNVGGINSTTTVKASNIIQATQRCDNETQGGTSTCTLQ